MSYAWPNSALDGDNLTAALQAARRVSPLKLADALRICLLMAANEDERYERAALRWIGRLLDEQPELELADLRMIVEALGRLAVNQAGARQALIGVLERYRLHDAVAALEQPIRRLQAEIDNPPWRERSSSSEA